VNHLSIVNRLRVGPASRGGGVETNSEDYHPSGWLRLREGCSQDAEYQADGPVDLSGLDSIEAAGEITEPGRVDGTHLVDEHAGPCSIHVDLGPKDSGLRADRGRGDDQRGQRNSIALDGHRIPWAALFMPGSVFRGA
jgi:hypothetical protein